MAKLSEKYQIERKYISFGKSRSGQKLVGVKFVVEHETANNNADADDHYNYFNRHPLYASAHAFIDAKKILEIIPLDEKAWHVNYDKPMDNKLFGDDANDAAIGVELCRPGNFKEAYDRYVWYNAYLCHKFGLKPEKHLVAHSVLDPQRRSDPESWLKPNGVNWSQFIKDVRNYYDNWNGKVEQSKPKPQPAPVTKPQKSIDELAQEVIKGLHGTGVQREKSLGSQYFAVQNRVNELLGAKPKPTSKPQKSIDQLAREVIDGKHGSGDARKKSLGNQYDAVQDRVNQLLGVKSTSSKPQPKKLGVGVKVQLLSSARKYATGENIPQSVRGKTFTIMQVKSDRVLLKEIYSWVYIKDVK